jgi:anti-sigma B factor antagonist
MLYPSEPRHPYHPYHKEKSPVEDLFTIRASRASDGTVRLLLAGELDLAGRPQLTACIDDLLDESAVTGVVVDLAGLTFIDSTGISGLVVSHNRAQELGKTLSAEGSRGQVREVLELVGVAAFLAEPDAPGES